jgi:Calcineurin-like phosphoesterase
MRGSRHRWRRLIATSVAALAGLLVLTSGAASAAAPASYRGAFFYPWFPETSTVNGQPVHFGPNLQANWPYDSADAQVVDKHIDSMKYGRLQFGIYSWFGRGTSSDRRLQVHLDRAVVDDASAHGFKWALYYECEGNACASTPGSPSPSSAQISADLAYLRQTYGSSPALMRLGGKPVVFVYGGPEDVDCGVADRWARAGEAANFHVVLKVFSGYATCANRPSGGWHQYGPAVRQDRQGDHSFAISPGFWRADEATPRLARDTAAWAANVRNMAASGAKWQLVTTWNEWGEGSAVESAVQWPTQTGNGSYVASLRVDGQPFGSSVPPACADRLDNDFDGTQDAADSGCASATDTTEDGGGTTPPPSGRDPVVLAAGDIQPQSSTPSVTSRMFAGLTYDRVLAVGDLQYETGSLSNFQNYWGPAWGARAPNSKLLPAPGNHESTKGGYCSYFTGKVAVADPCPDPTASNPQFYKVTLGAWSIYSLDTGRSSSTGGDLTAAEKSWLDRQLAADTNKCQLVMWHHPRYSAGHHGPSAGLDDDWRTLVNRRVDLVLSGHEHNYQRWSKMAAGGVVDNANGVRQVLVGTGGAEVHPTGSRPAAMLRYSNAQGLTQLTLHANSYDGRFLPAPGNSFTDSWTDACR